MGTTGRERRRREARLSDPRRVLRRAAASRRRSMSWRRRSAISRDVTLRALDTLAAADLVACEDTRVTRRLLDRYGISAKVTAYHEHSGAGAHRRLLDALAEGRSVALVSDAGTPLLSDPGAALVKDAVGGRSSRRADPGRLRDRRDALRRRPSDRRVPLRRLPADEIGGAAESASRRSPQCRRRSSSSNRRTASARSLPTRAPSSAASACAALCREVTKIHETFDRGTLAELAARYEGASVKGEIVLLVAPPAEARIRPTQSISTRRSATRSARWA